MKGPLVFLALPIFFLTLAGCSHPAAAQASTANAAPANPKGTLTKLLIQEVKVGNGGQFSVKHAAAIGDRLYVVYTGKLANGTAFDSNDGNGKPPLDITLGDGSVIKGWEQGLIGMKVGGERKLSIPASLGYGDQDKGPIPVIFDLFFDVKLLDIVAPGHENDVMINDLRSGSGPEIKKGDHVTIHFTVTDVQGNELDSDNGSGFSWTFGNGSVFDGLETGLTGMKQGGERMIHLGPAVMMMEPSKRGMYAQPSAQLVKVELVKVKSGA